MEKLPEPWLRGTLTDVAPVQRAVLHALELAKEDIQRWCGDLSDEQLNARPGGRHNYRLPGISKKVKLNFR